MADGDDTGAGFRPLTGILFSNSLLIRPNIQGLLSFRPLTGILFSNKKRIRWTSSSLKSFRPLTGILFSNSILTESVVLFREEFPSPHGDFVFERKSRSA